MSLCFNRWPWKEWNHSSVGGLFFEGWPRPLLPIIYNMITCPHSGQGCFDRLPYHLIPQSARDLAESIRARQTSRGCGPVLWKWIMKQPWRHLFYVSLRYTVWCDLVNINVTWGIPIYNEICYLRKSSAASIWESNLQPEDYVFVKHVESYNRWQHCSQVRIPLTVESWLKWVTPFRVWVWGPLGKNRTI